MGKQAKDVALHLKPGGRVAVTVRERHKTVL